MKDTKKTLKRGSDAALPAPELIPVAALAPHADNRDLSDDRDLSALAASIKAAGLLNPIRARKLDDGNFEILAGVRRWRAVQLLEHTSIATYVVAGCDDLTADQVRFIENEHRREPTALDTAKALRRMKNQHGLTHEALAGVAGIQVDRVKRYLSIFEGSDAVLLAVEQHALPITLVVELVRYQKARGDVAVRAILPRVLSGELTSRDLIALRKRRTTRAGARRGTRAALPPAKRLPKLVASLEPCVVAAPAAAVPLLEALLERARSAAAMTTDAKSV